MIQWLFYCLAEGKYQFDSSPKICINKLSYYLYYLCKWYLPISGALGCRVDPVYGDAKMGNGVSISYRPLLNAMVKGITGLTGSNTDLLKRKGSHPRSIGFQWSALWQIQLHLLGLKIDDLTTTFEIAQIATAEDSMFELKAFVNAIPKSGFEPRIPAIKWHVLLF